MDLFPNDNRDIYNFRVTKVKKEWIFAKLILNK